MLKLENSIRGLSFSRVAFDLTIQDIKVQHLAMPMEGLKHSVKYTLARLRPLWG